MKIISSVLFIICAILIEASDSAQIPSSDYAVQKDRLINGWPALPGMFPHYVHLQVFGNIGSFSECGGVLIHPQWVLTTAHCIYDKKFIYLRFGAVNVTEPSLILVDYRTFAHHDFDGINHDIALIDVGRWVRPTDLIKPIKLPGREAMNKSYEGLTAIISGYGDTKFVGKYSELLHYGYVGLFSHEECAKEISIVDSTLCGYRLEDILQTTCWGDGGGALIVYGEDKKPSLIGINVIRNGKQCDVELHYPMTFTRPEFYHDWLTQVTGIIF